MTSLKKFLSLFIMIIVSFSLTACDFSFNGQHGEIINNLTNLSAPIVNENISDNTVRWSSVANADAYIVNMNGHEARTTDLSYPISGLIQESCEVSIKVKAKGNGIMYSDSEWSSIFVYNYIKNDNQQNPKKLETPRPSYDNTKNNFSWEAIAGAAGYYVSINNGDPEPIATTSYYPNVKENETFTFKIMASASQNNNLYLDSDWSFEQSFTYKPYVITKCTAELNNNLENDYTCSRDDNYYYYVFKLGKIYDVIISPEYEDYGGAINDVTQEKIITKVDVTEIGSEITEFIQNETHYDYSLSDETEYTHSSSMEKSMTDSINFSLGIKASDNNISGDANASGSSTNNSKYNVTNSITHTIKSSKNWGYSNLESLNKNYSQAVKNTTESTYKISFTFRKDDAKGRYIVSGELCIIDVFSIIMIDPFTKEYGISNIALISNSSSINSPIFIGEGVKEYKNEPDIKLDIKNFNIDNLLKNNPTKDVDGNEIPIGNKLNPIELNNENFSSIREGLDKHYILVEDIDLSEITSWLPIGCDRPGNEAIYTPFTGSLNGNFYTINGLQSAVPSGMSGNSSYKGLFAQLSNGACIENLFIKNCNYTYNHESFEDKDANKFVGVIAGESSDAVIRNVSIKGNIAIGENGSYGGGVYYVGGIVGRTTGETSIISCAVNMNIYARNNSVCVGGIVGDVYNDGLKISHSYSTGTLEANGNDWYGSHTWSRAGGIVGMSWSYGISINDCVVYTKTPIKAHGASNDTIFGINRNSNFTGAIIADTNNKNKDTIVNNTYLIGTASNSCSIGTIGYTKEFEENEIHSVSFSNNTFNGLAFCEFKNEAGLIESNYKNCWIYSSTEFIKLWFETKYELK